jgi:hypothetical protein
MGGKESAEGDVQLMVISSPGWMSWKAVTVLERVVALNRVRALANEDWLLTGIPSDDVLGATRRNMSGGKGAPDLGLHAWFILCEEQRQSLCFLS